MSLNFTTDTSTQLTYSSFPFATTYDNVNPWSKSSTNTNLIYNTSLSGGRVGIGLNNPNAMLEITDTTYKIKIGSRTDAGWLSVNHLICNIFFRFLTSHATDIAYFGYITNYETPSIEERVMVLQITKTALNMTGDIYASGNAGIGVSPSPTYKLNVNGSINSTSLYQNGIQIDFSSYATNTNLTNNYYNKTTTDTLLNAKQQAITTYSITGATGGNIGFSTTTSTLTLGMPNNYTQNMSISNLITPTSFIYKGTELSTTLGNYSTTAINDTTYLKLNGTNSMSLNSSISLTGTGKFSGDGSLLTNLTYNNITGKPTNFQADWTTTIINKPTNFQADWTTTIINRPTYFTPDPTTYYNKTEVNGLTTLTNFYNKTEVNGLTTLTNFYNKTEVNGLTTLTNFYNKTDSDGRYLQLSGGTMTGNIDCKSIALTGADAFAWEDNTADTSNKTNTYINFRNAGATSDWCYLRQIGGYNAYKLALDFYDDGNDARFCIRNVNSVASPDVATEVFTVDSGNVSCTGTLTANSFSGDGANITNLTYGNITGKPTNFQADWTTTIINRPTYFTPDPTIYYNKTEVNGLTTLTNFYNKTDSDGRFLQLSGGSLTGALNLTGLASGNNPLYISSTNTTANNCIQIKNNSTYYAYIGLGGSAFGGNYANNVFIESASSSIILNTNGRYSTSTPNLIIHSSGNIGIGTTNPSNILQIGNGGKLRISNGTTDFSLIGTIDTDGATNTRIIISGNTRASPYTGHIEYIATSTGNHMFYTTDTNTERMRIKSDGNIGIGTTNPNTLLEIYNSTNPKIYLNTAGTTRCFLSSQSTGLDLGNDVGTGKYIRFMPDNVEKMRIDSDGNVNIVNTLKINNTAIYNYLFNNNGANHGTYQDFNNIDKFGFTFIQNSTNGPGTASQYYSWYLGLGNEYPFANSTNGYYGMQFAIGRSETYPKLSVRRKENGSWTSWEGLTAEKAVSLTSGNKTIDGVLTMGNAIKFKSDVWNNSTDDKNRFYFQTNGRTYFRGYGTPTLSDNAFEFMNTAGTVILGINDNGNAYFLNQISCRLYTTTSQNPHDYVGVPYETASGATSNYTLQLILNSFTAFHRNFTNDELFDENDPQLFKDTYEGRIVISTGKIGTQIGNEKDGYDIKYDKEGIFIEDTHPIVELSRNKKDKRVFGVLGRKDRKNSNEKRLIVNSVGEGGIWVCNSNGIIENGDYITSSNYLGYGEKQDSEFIANYTVAKATMECNFELDSPLYNCIELDEGIRIAFIGCTYHCG